MDAIIDLIERFDMTGMVVLVLVLLFLGSKTAGDRPTVRRLCWVIATALFVGLIAAVLARRGIAGNDQVADLTLRILLVAGFVLGALWILSPLFEAVYVHFFKGIAAAYLSRRARIRETAAAEKKRREETERRKQEEEAWRLAAPERERAKKQAEDNAKLQAKAQKRRDDARTACELLFHRYAHVLGDRFPKATFDDFAKRYLGDDHAPEYVEERSRQLLEVIGQHVEQIEPPKTPFTIQSLAAWYQSTKKLIDELPVEDRYKQAQLAHLNARYAELMQTVMETLRP